MMRLTWITVFTFLIVAETFGQQAVPQQQNTVPTQQNTVPTQQNAQQQLGQPVQQASNQAAGNQAAAGGQVQPVAANAAPQQPFKLTAQQTVQLNALLLRWQKVSSNTKTLDCKFQRWHFDQFAAPAGIHATKAVGIIKYATPDKGLFRVDQLMFYKGMQGGKPQFGPQPGKYGEHWVCNGKQLIEFDRTQKQCRVQNLPEGMQGQAIFNSPLPFVFNLNAKQIMERYWVREVKAPKDDIHLIEAWPKRRDDRAQYKLVQIALNKETLLPQALIMYAPNFNVRTAQKFDHYEFADMKQNGVTNRIAEFMNSFIPQQPPADWQIVRGDMFDPQQQAKAPAAGEQTKQR